MSDASDISALKRQWMHSFEEDTDDQIVLRPIDYEFPRTRRGRDRLNLADSGVAELATPGPADRGVTGAQTWSLDGDQLTISGPSSSSRLSGRFELLSVDERKLVLRHSQ